MKKASDNISEDDVLKMLRNIDDDPASYDALIDNWNLIFDLGRQQGNDTFGKLEDAASSHIPSITEAASSAASPIGWRVGHLLEQFDSPAYLVKQNGQVTAQNSAASRTYQIGPSGSLDALPFALEQGEWISDVVRTSLKPGRNSHDAVLRRAFSTTSDSSVTLSIAPSMAAKSGEGTALVFVIDARWKTDAAELIKREFDLTRAEKELLIAFLDGQTTQDMAEARQRSHETIRTQFHSLMVKMSAQSQTELLRNALSVSQFVDQVEEIAEVVRHPHRKRVDIVRPGGRSVEITMAGDLAGTPLVFLQDAVTYTFTGKVEQVFRDKGYCVLSMCRPGYGDTDPPLAGEPYLETFAADLDALLDQLGHRTCMLLSAGTSSTFMFGASQYFSDRITGLIQLDAAVPRSYFDDMHTSSSWAQGALNAAEKHGVLQEFVIKSGIRAWKKIGSARFMRAQFRNASVGELELVTEPEALRESQRALDIATKQNLDYLVADTFRAFSDYKAEVAATKLPILVIHGVDDSVFPIGAIRDFAKDYGDRTTLIELPNAGFLSINKHTDVVMEHIAEFQRENS